MEEIKLQYKYLSDCHIHSDCSRDAEDPVTMMCEAGERQGLYAVTVTDHCECNVYQEEQYDRSVRQSYFEAKKAAAVFQSRMRVYAGVELGQPVQNLRAAEDILTACDFDFVLGSLHNLAGMEDFYFLDYVQEEVPALLGRYFDEILEMVKWDGFDSLAHLTYPYRYIVGDKGLHAELFPDFQEKIDEILSLLAHNQKALELNTSGLRQKLGQTLPPLEVLKRFRQLGGTYVTIGSDAHRWTDIASGLNEGMSLLSQAGFDQFTIYIGREPLLLPIQ